MSAETLTYSIIVPVRDAERFLPKTLMAIRHAADVAKASYELIAVDDGSQDQSKALAESMADVVLETTGAPVGPAAARNLGNTRAKGTWLIFVDADVQLQPNAISALTASLAKHPEAGAIFGAYDDAPAAPGLVSQFRNLLHHYVHTRAAGPAETFWAGIGAVRRDLFDVAGGFDARQFPHPSIEDVELGYRLRDLDTVIILDPSIRGTHLKRWTLLDMVRTDLFRRGIPWMRLLRSQERKPTLAIAHVERLKVIVAGVSVLATAAAIALRSGGIALVGGLAVGTLVTMNLPVHAWFARQRGVGFALATIPLMVLYYLVALIAAMIGVTVPVGSPADSREPHRTSTERRL